ncbi:hypothetical protein C3747_204g139c [Trypanosoma cruzi]|uniref:Uncharacterized protein n=2 Tax=Trypanosoma cruzi TaxID=5693 RepID=Q4E0X9_TRYCC|nr:hypothetical protein, conserved [Trypanosoma cruzi]EAN98426.1 hypothetical protein, conserved [Trypanosoma cruzi]PWV00891.1 hypothetical protein C3747_204g139c [Trypanosoma cruzi]RNC57605.1 hypothetical protein TcCL_ESM04794 [Trypanosoma cruzi]|eukprot:XP_820277.1 hypothetical protein [Trypanosoma cruzi strain CL Brener]
MHVEAEDEVKGGGVFSTMHSTLASTEGEDFIKRNLEVLDALIKEGYSVTGAVQARFINNYDPMYDKPYTHYELNTGRYLNEELSQLLEDDRRKNTKHHLQTDKIEKFYMLALLAHSAILRH